MRKYLKIYMILFAAAISLISCDRITEPYTKSGEPVEPEDTTKVYVKAFLEDYTGAMCGNCPAAASKAAELKSIYGENLIVLGIHSGFYAKPSGTKYTYDFRTAEGDEYDTFFGVSAIGNPNGIINRTAVNGSKILAYNAWGARVAEIIKMEADVKLELKADYVESSRTIQVKANMNYLKSASSQNYITVLIMEDSIVKYQKNYTTTPADIPDYVHNHVLRGSLNGAWGEQLSTSAIAKGAKLEKTYNFQIPETKDWRTNKLKIVAFVYDKNADYKVLQAEEVDLIK